MDSEQRQKHIQHNRQLRGFPAHRNRHHADSVIERPKSQIFLPDPEEDRRSESRSEYSYECQAADLAHELAQAQTKLAEEKTKMQTAFIIAKEHGLENLDELCG